MESLGTATVVFGWSPADFWSSTPAEFLAAVEQYNRINAKSQLSEDQIEAAAERVNAAKAAEQAAIEREERRRRYRKP